MRWGRSNVVDTENWFTIPGFREHSVGLVFLGKKQPKTQCSLNPFQPGPCQCIDLQMLALAPIR